MRHSPGLRWKLAGAALALAAAASVVPLARPDGTTQKLYVTFLISQAFRVTTADGTSIGAASPPGTTIAPGTYELVFDNNQNVKNMNFQLTGPNVSLQESMGGGEETSMSDYATFLPSSQYSFHDANNINAPTFYLQTAAAGGSVGANGSGLPGANTATAGGATSNATVVGSKGASVPSTSSGGATVPFRGTLTGTVSAAGTLTLTLNGRPVATLKTGRYTVSVTDRSAKGGFTIQEKGQQPTTLAAVPFVGSRKATLTFRPGQWFFYATFVGKKTYFLVTG